MNRHANTNINAVLTELLKRNEQKIRLNTPKNPCLTKDDEWYHDEKWDNFYEELAKR